jgi:hypothetical protein
MEQCTDFPLRPLSHFPFHDEYPYIQRVCHNLSAIYEGKGVQFGGGGLISSKNVNTTLVLLPAFAELQTF